MQPGDELKIASFPGAEYRGLLLGVPLALGARELLKLWGWGLSACHQKSQSATRLDARAGGLEVQGGNVWALRRDVSRIAVRNAQPLKWPLMTAFSFISLNVFAQFGQCQTPP